MPPPRDISDLKMIFPKATEGKEVIATQAVIDDLASLKSVTASRKSLEKLEKEIQFRICSYMGEADTLVADKGGTKLATWKQQFRKGYTVKESQFRVFLPKFKEIEEE